MYYNPIELKKLCCNVVVKEFYDENQLIFQSNINELNLPQDIIDVILDRYKLIKHIIKHGGNY